MQVPGAREVAVEFFSMSKSYNMAGWRIGFMVGNKDLVYALSRIKGYHDYGTFTPIQVASIAALEGPQECVADIAMKYQKRRDVLVKGLHEADRKSTRLNSSHITISYAVFCLKKKTTKNQHIN